MSSNITILNPNTPLAYLSPEVADLVQSRSYVTVATLSVSILSIPTPSTKETAPDHSHFSGICVGLDDGSA
jgi:hypothetical protein